MSCEFTDEEKLANSRLVSLITRCIAIQSRVDRGEINDTTEITTSIVDIRYIYVRMLESLNHLRTRLRFESISEEIKKSISIIFHDNIKNNDTNRSFMITTFHGGNWSSQVLDGSKSVMVGRLDFCEVKLPTEDLTLSRLNAIIIPCPNINKMFIIDVGSVLGITMLERSSGKKLVNSTPTFRSVMIMDYDETVVVRLGQSLKLCINPKECVVCYENTREVVTDCGHYIVCSKCVKKINECPLCRKQITKSKEDLNAHTMKV